MTLCERGLTAIHDRRPRSGRVLDRETDPEIRPEITFLTLPNHNLREEALGLRRYDRGRVISSDDIGRWKAEHIKKVLISIMLELTSGSSLCFSLSVMYICQRQTNKRAITRFIMGFYT
jgi:hypothetical protein